MLAILCFVAACSNRLEYEKREASSENDEENKSKKPNDGVFDTLTATNWLIRLIKRHLIFTTTTLIIEDPRSLLTESD